MSEQFPEGTTPSEAVLHEIDQVQGSTEETTQESTVPATTEPANIPPEVAVPNSEEPGIRDLSHMQSEEHLYEQGFDSDGNDRPFNRYFDFDSDDEEEDDIPVRTEERSPEDAATAATAVTADAAAEKEVDLSAVHEDIPDDEFNKLKVGELKLQLKLRKQTISGKKDELKTRLRVTLAEKKPKYTAEQLEAMERAGKKKKKDDDAAADGMKSFPRTAFWKPLVPNSEIVYNPENPTFFCARPPTLPKDGDITQVKTKHNFTERIDVPLFKGRDVRDKLGRGGRIMKDPTTKKPINSICLTDGCVTASGGGPSCSGPWVRF